MIKRGSIPNANTGANAKTEAEDVLDFPLGSDVQTSASTYNDVSIPRLYAYHRVLAQAGGMGQATITSHALAELLGNTIAPAQIRRDLSTLGTLGRRGHGYAINPLVEQLAWVLGLEHDWRIAIVGFGYLGHAFATFITARERRFRVTAIFDNSPTVIGQRWQGITVCDVAEMENVLTTASANTASLTSANATVPANTASLCNIGVIAVPADAAQSCAQRFADLGIRAILNFAPASLTVPRSVVLRNIDLAGEMSILTHHLAATAESEKALG